MRIECDETELREALEEAFRTWPVRYMRPQGYEFANLVVKVLEEVGDGGRGTAGDPEAVAGE